MILALLGFIAGLVTASLIAILFAFFKAPLYKITNTIATSVGNAGPRARGFLMEPEDETAIARKEIIARNAREGRDTPISELQ